MKRMALALVATTLVLAGCADAPSGSELGVSLDEWSIEVTPERFDEGPVTVDIWNDGEFPHTLVVENPFGDVIAATDPITPGDNRVLILDLTGAEYRFTCRIVTSRPDGTIVDHFAEGMVANLAASDAAR